MMLTVRGQKVQVNNQTFIKWYRFGKVFQGHLYGSPYITPYGEVMEVYPLHNEGRLDFVHLICEDDVIDVDPFIKWRPSLPDIPHISWEDWKSRGN